MSITVIIPAAGQSTRFPGMKPKWLLTQPSGDIMLIEALGGLNNLDIDRVVIALLRDHVEQYKFSCQNLIDRMKFLGYKNVDITLLDKSTISQPETVIKAIRNCKIKDSIFIKDVDNMFSCALPKNNSATIYDVGQMQLAHIANKSFVTYDDNGIITNIVEKKVISQEFCVGGYSFENASMFDAFFHKLNNSKDLYVSHIIFRMMMDGIKFHINRAYDYKDWGTSEEWFEYRSHYATLFIDIDGIIFKDGHQFCEPFWGTTECLKNNVSYIKELYDSGKVYIALTTSRPESYKELTVKQLDENEISYHTIIFGLPNAKRIVIDDYSDTSAHRSCDAINIMKNSDILPNMLKGLM